MTFGSNNFTDFPDNQMTKFCVVWCVITLFIGWSWIFTPLPPKFLWSIALCFPHRMDASACYPKVKSFPHFHPLLSPSPSFPITTIPPFLVLSFHFSALLLWHWCCILQRKQLVSLLSAWNRHASEPVFSFESQTFRCTVLLYQHIGLPLMSRLLLEYSLIPKVL